MQSRINIKYLIYTNFVCNLVIQKDLSEMVWLVQGCVYK